MRANHSPLRFFGLIATASVLASGVYASAALAATTPATTGSNGASASPVLVGASSASDDGNTQSRGRNAGGRRFRSDFPGNARRPTTTTTTNGGLLGPTSGPRASGSATPGQQLVQVTTPAAPAKPGSPTLPRQSTRVDIAITPFVGGGNSTGASTSAPSDRLRPRRPPRRIPHPPTPLRGTRGRRSSLRGRLPRRGRLRGNLPRGNPSRPRPRRACRTRHRPSRQPPTATNPVATESVATEPVATQSLKARSAPLSPGNRARTLHQFQTLVTQRLGVEADQVARPVTAPDSPPSSPPSPPSPGLAKGHLGPAPGSPQILAGDTDLERGSASVAAAPRRPEQSPKPPSVARSRAAVAPPTPQALSPAPPVQTRLPVGGAAAATGGGIGSVAPSVVADFEPLALALATILLARFSLDRAMWRSTLLASRLEHPG